MPRNETRYREVRNAAANYQETVHTVLAFAALVCHDGRGNRPGSFFGIGRRMATSDANRISPLAEVTPDLVAQRSGTYGIAVEVKKSMPLDQTYWMSSLDQLLKYDDALTGWKTESQQMPVSDACLLIHQSRGRAFVSFMTTAAEKSPAKAVLNGAVIEFNRSDEAAPYIFFRREHGTLRDSGLSQELRDGVQVPVERVLESYPNLRYYDAEPTLEYVMQNLWMDHLISRSIGVAPNERGLREFTVNVAELTAEAQKAFGSGALLADGRSATFPDTSWIRKGLDGLVRVKLARLGTTPDTYSILFRTFPRSQDLLERFVSLLDKHKAPPPEDGGQLSLLTPAPGPA